MRDNKPFWQSKVFWVNIIYIVLVIINSKYPTVSVSAETQAYILAAVNLILRMFTGKEITLG